MEDVVDDPSRVLEGSVKLDKTTEYVYEDTDDMDAQLLEDSAQLHRLVNY